MRKEFGAIAALAGSFAVSFVMPAAAADEVDALWGHLRYRDATNLSGAAPAYPWDAPEPAAIGCRVRPEVLPSLRALLADAHAAGFRLLAMSCFRSVDRQIEVFWGGIEDRTVPDPQAIAARARLSAPPGFSEHHTGYAIDFCDGAVPASCESFEPGFAQTPAGAWLLAHGADYGFELTFPGPDDACVAQSSRAARDQAYEPWHWRFVASPIAQEVFAEARARFPLCPLGRDVVAGVKQTTWAEDQFARWSARLGAMWSDVAAWLGG